MKSAFSFFETTAKRTSGSLIPFVLIALFMAPSLAWILLDRRVFMWDQSWYGEVSTDLYFNLTHGLGSWYTAMVTAMPSKPPLMVWLAQFFVPIGYVAGSIDVSLLCFVFLAHSVALVVIWTAASIIAPMNYFARILAVLMAGSAPLFVGMTHQFVVEPLQVLCVSCSLLLCLVANRLHVVNLVSLLIIAVVAGFAVKTTSAVYCGVSWTYVFFVVLQRAKEMNTITEISRRVGILLVVVAVMFTVLTCYWYYLNFYDVLGHIRDATSGADAELYGRRDTLFAKLPFWIKESNNALFIVSWILPLLLIVSAAVLLASKMFRSADQYRDHSVVVLACILQTVVPVLFLASQPPEETRYLVAFVPCVAVMTAWLFRLRALRGFAFTGCILLGIQAGLVNAQALDSPIHFAQSAWLWPLNRDRTDRIVARNIVIDTCRESSNMYINVIGPEYPQMNANSMAFFSAKERLVEGYRCFYTSLGYAETNVERAIRRVEDLKAPYIVLPHQQIDETSANPFNRVLAPIQQRISGAADYRFDKQVGDYGLFERLGEP